MLNRLFITLSLLATGNLMASTTLTAIDAAFDQGELTQDERILNKVYSFLQPELLDARFQVDELEIIKCGTPILIEYETLQPVLSESTINTIENLLLPSSNGLRSTYFSPGGHFSFDYSTDPTEDNRVPAKDADASRISDYVEWTATYLDYTWAQEVDSAGFAGPNHVGGDGFYNVSFEDMGAYGYCTTSSVDGSELTRLVLNNNFLGFGSNQDPEGNVKGSGCGHPR